jgi:hypothetical protein
MDPFWTGIAYMAAFGALIYGGALAAKWWLERHRKPPPGVLLVAMLALTMLSAPALAGPTRVLKVVGPYPSGYRQSGGYCAPTSDRSQPAVPTVMGYAPPAIFHRRHTA